MFYIYIDVVAVEIPVPGVGTEALAQVIRYMREHRGVEPPIVEKPLRSKVMKDVCPYKWDATFIDEIGEVRQDLYNLILAANYMDIKSLLHLGCAKVASLIKGQPLEAIKGILDPAGDKERLVEKNKRIAADAAENAKKAAAAAAAPKPAAAAAGAGSKGSSPAAAAASSPPAAAAATKPAAKPAAAAAAAAAAGR